MFYVQTAARFGKPSSIKISGSPVAAAGRRRPQCSLPLSDTAATSPCIYPDCLIPTEFGHACEHGGCAERRAP
jgi:hypothetical protein